MKSILRSEYFPLFLLVLINTSIALFVLPQYGQGWDEDNFFLYARESLNAYANIGNHSFSLTFQDPTLRYYGPWFLMVIVLAGKLFPHVLLSDVAHFLTFLVFQGGVVLFYLLARRWFSRLPALGATLLFSLQPVLWGHAFINARDIPFMVGFIGSIYFGLRLVDSLSTQALDEPKSSSNELNGLVRADTAGWKFLKKIGLALSMIVGLAVFGGLALRLASLWKANLYVNLDTTSARDFELYLRPLLADFWAGVIFISLSLAWVGLVFLPFMPTVRSYLWKHELKPIFSQVGGYARNPHFITASLLLGLTIATRILGAAAGVLVIIFLFARYKRGASLPMLAYVLFSLPLVYLTWPFLWSEPLARLLITLRVMLKFPWPGQVLFDGALYAGNELPRTYFLKLLAFQLTEPALGLIGLGLVIVLWQIFRKKIRLELGILAALWFVLPLIVEIVGRPYLYDNFRQLMFTLPPLFLLVGVAIEWLLKLLNKKAFQVACIALLAVPGIWGGVTLHPYEYIYYNSLAGGARGAQGRFELDYWGTSLRAMADYVNANLPLQANVVVWGSPPSFSAFARPDLKVYDSRDTLHPQTGIYAIILRRADWDLLYYPDLPALYTVSVQGVPLACLKYVQP